MRRFLIVLVVIALTATLVTLTVGGASAQEQQDGTTRPDAELNDQVVNDDLIVKGRVCLSQDLLCVDGQVFDGLWDLLILDSVPRIALEDNTSLDWELGHAPSDDDFYLFNDTRVTPLNVEQTAPNNALQLTGGGMVVNGVDNAKLSVREGSATDARRTMFELVNNGPAEFRFQDTSTVVGNTWYFSLRGDNSFEINKLGTGGPEAVFKGNGGVDFGGKTKTFSLSPTGNVAITGSLTEGSSRSIKTRIVPVSAAEVLSSILELPVYEWSYRSDGATRHVGPMAEDFYAAFGLGSGPTGIAAVDSSGVALAAVQALAAHNAELEARIAELEAMVAVLMGD